MDWLRAERPSEYTLAYSVETLLFSIIPRCLRYVGEPVDVRAGLLLQSRRRHRRTRRVPREGVQLPVSSEDEPYIDQLSNRALHGRGDLVPTCQPVQIAELAKSETQNDGN
jgi:hypothetical protein